MIKYVKNVFLFLFVCELSLQVTSDKVKAVNLNTWNLNNENGTVKVNNLRSPIGVYSALQDLYGSILNSQNDDSLRWIAYDNWTFSTSFSATFDKDQRINLTLHGIDTVSIVYLNNYEIGKTDNMFVRYSYDILPYLKSENILQIKIISPVLVAKIRADLLQQSGITAPPNCPPSQANGECHRNMLRKMQSSFGGSENVAALSMGIWKPVELEYYEVAIMRDVDVAIRRNNTHWTLDMQMFLSADVKQNFYCEVTFIAVELLDSPLIFKRDISYNSLQIDFKVNIPKEKIKLWWPNGYGEQKLYPLYFACDCWLNKAGRRLKSRTKSQKTIDIGFRTIELVENLDDFGRTFYFKVNNQAIFIKGANYLPSHMLPEYSYRENKLLHLLKSAKDTHLNMIRVWAGGLYESDTFYNLTDYYGLLVWQDLAFTSSTYPVSNLFVESVRKEISQNARRLAFHPSLCVIVTNDEIELYLSENIAKLGLNSTRLEEDYRQLFKGTIRPELNIISRNDFNPRAGPMISTPSMGVEGTNKELLLDPQNPNYGDVHFWEDEKDGWDPDIYPLARFISKFGFQSLPVLASWNRTIYSNDTLSNIVQHRQHDPNGFKAMLKLISLHFPFPTSELVKNIDVLIYLSQLSQAIATKTAMDVFRSHRMHKRTMGALYWHLNDNWVAPTCSSIDYFGNYKIVWYWSKEFMAPNVIMALMDVKNSKVNVTVTNEEVVDDIEEPKKFNITMYTYLWSELYHRRSITWDISLGANGISTNYLDIKTLFNPPFTQNNCFFKFVLTQFNKTLSSTFLIPGKIDSSNGLTDPVLNYGITSTYCLQTNIEYLQYHTITITVQKPALFVYLDVYHPAVQRYKLSDNGILITEPIKVIQLEIVLKSSTCITLTKEHVRIQTLNELFSNAASNMSSTNKKENIAQVPITNATENSTTEKNQETVLGINHNAVVKAK